MITADLRDVDSCPKLRFPTAGAWLCSAFSERARSGWHGLHQKGGRTGCQPMPEQALHPAVGRG